MKAARMSRMRVMGCTGSLQNSDSMKCCSRRCLNTLTVGAASAGCNGPQPNLCCTGGRTYKARGSGHQTSNCELSAHSPILSASNHLHTLQCKATVVGMCRKCQCLPLHHQPW